MNDTSTDELRNQLRDLPRTQHSDVRYPIDAYEDDLVSLFKAWSDRRVANIRIRGKTLDECTHIIAGLELERLTGIQVTMENLQTLYNRLVEDLKEQQSKALERAVWSALKKEDHKYE